MATDDKNDGLNLDNEDRLPWLEAADSYDDEEAVSPTRLLLLVLGGLVLIGAVLGGLWWLQGGGSRGEGELIAAQEGPYKQPPASDGAKQFEGEGDASFAASEGAEPAGKLDPSKMPEAPAVAAAPAAKAPEAAKTVPPPAKAPAAAAPAAKAEMAKGPAPVAKAPVVASKAAPAPAKAAPAKAAPSPAAGGGATIQLGAFSSEESAAKAWISLSKRFAYLQGLSKSVAPAEVGGNRVYRLRAVAASGAAASDICGKLRVAGENCAVIR
jgi:hypothetical protein